DPVVVAKAVSGATPEAAPKAPVKRHEHVVTEILQVALRHAQPTQRSPHVLELRLVHGTEVDAGGRGDGGLDGRGQGGERRELRCMVHDRGLGRALQIRHGRLIYLKYASRAT